MTTILQYAKKVGGSLMVRIPKEVAEIEQIRHGQMVKLEVHRLRKDWFGALKGIGQLKKKEKLSLHD